MNMSFVELYRRIICVECFVQFEATGLLNGLNWYLQPAYPQNVIPPAHWTRQLVENAHVEFTLGVMTCAGSVLESSLRTTFYYPLKQICGCTGYSKQAGCWTVAFLARSSVLRPLPQWPSILLCSGAKASLGTGPGSAAELKEREMRPRVCPLNGTDFRATAGFATCRNMFMQNDFAMEILFFPPQLLTTGTREVEIVFCNCGLQAM